MRKIILIIYSAAHRETTISARTHARDDTFPERWFHFLRVTIIFIILETHARMLWMWSQGNIFKFLLTQLILSVGALGK